MSAPLYQFTYTPGADDDVAVGVMVDALVDAYTTPSALARVLGVSRPAVYDWRHGAIPSPHTYDRIVELYEHLTAWDVA